MSRECVDSTREVGYQPDDRARLIEALDKIEPLPLRVIAVMHGLAIASHFRDLIRSFRNNSLAIRTA
jgi:hypothetical protein